MTATETFIEERALAAMKMGKAPANTYQRNGLARLVEEKGLNVTDVIGKDALLSKQVARRILKGYGWTIRNGKAYQ